MMVRWEKIAVAALADAWLAADSHERRLIVDAAAQIDQLLATAPEESGESRPEGRRVLFVSPLGVLFKVGGDAVSVLRVWRLRKRGS